MFSPDPSIQRTFEPSTAALQLQPLPHADYALPAPHPEDAHLYATLQKIDQIANEDVEMHSMLHDERTFVVLDTNILLHHFEVLQQFTAEAEMAMLPVAIVIPGIVIHELDGQKNRDGLGWFARRASAWLLKKVKERKNVKGQAEEETCKPSKNWKVRERDEEHGSDRANDHLIIDCARYYQLSGCRVLLCSADHNLCFDCEAAHLPTILPSNRWSSRDLVQAIFGTSVDLGQFSTFRASYRDPKSSRKPAIALVDDDGMEVDSDEDAYGHRHALPSHGLDLLHLQIIEHFTALLVELVGRVAGPEILQIRAGEGSSASRYAPSWAKKPYTEWSAPDCVEYFDSKTRRATKETWPRLDAFLTLPYRASGRGGRRGQDWSRRDWDVALAALKELGEVWQEASIKESLGVLEPHVTAIFAEPMRPTGIGNTFG